LFNFGCFHFSVGSPTGPLQQISGTLTNNQFLTAPGKFMFKGGDMNTLIYVLALGDLDDDMDGERIEPKDSSPVKEGPGPKAGKLGPKDSKMGPLDVKKGTKQRPARPKQIGGKVNKPKKDKKAPQDMDEDEDEDDADLSQYPWAILSDASGTMLFVLARDSATFKQQYEQIVMQKVQSLGLTSSDLNLIAIEHPSNCMHPPMPIINQ
jgi:hypothetical protein